MAELTFWEWWEQNYKRIWESFDVMKPMLPQIKEIALEAWLTAKPAEEEIRDLFIKAFKDEGFEVEEGN